MFLIQTDLPGWQMASAMSHAIHKIVSKNAANLISYRGVRRITPKVKTVICEQAPNHGSYFAYARLIARVTFNLVCRKYPKNNEFRTKKFLNQGFLYGISSFCPFSENNSFYMAKSHVFVFFRKNCQQSTPSLRSSSSACSLVRKWMPWIPCSSAASTFFKVSSRNTLSSAFNP